MVAEAKSKKTRSRKLAEGLYVKCVSRKLARGRGSIAEAAAEAMNNFLSITKEKIKTHLSSGPNPGYLLFIGEYTTQS